MPDGWRLEPTLGWSQGEHRVDLAAVTRWRWENWRAFTDDASNMIGGRTRLALRYAWADRIALLAEGQQAFVGGLTSDSSGAAATYRANTPGGDESSVNGFGLRQLWAEGRLGEASLRVGRQPIQAGTGIAYTEPAWSYVKLQRLAQRLVGTVGWSTVERSYDGLTGAVDAGGYRADLYAGQPTTGVYEVRHGYHPNWDILFGGVELTAKRGTLVENSELSSFFIGYSDDRDPQDVSGLFGNIRVYTLGASWLGIYPLGPGAVDTLFWAAGQVGRYPDQTPGGVRNLDQRAYALIGEAGYQLALLPAKPWLRTGVNFASGDGDPDDGDHQTFFNLVPTNHPYYGFADQLAFQNLVDWFAQLRLFPLPKTTVDLFVHRFWLAEDADRRYAGSGAFSKQSLGFTSSASNGSRDVGTELDLVVGYAPSSHVSLQTGFCYLWGGDVFATSASRDVRWAYAQVEFSY